MAKERHALKLGKASAFVKSRLNRLRQEDDTWDANFFPIPCSGGQHDGRWMGLVLTKDIKDRRGVEMPPQEWNGRRCRFVRRSR